LLVFYATNAKCYGDAIEYGLTTIATPRHGTPCITLSDVSA